MKQQARHDPEALAIDALGFLAADADRLWRFLDVSGLWPDTLRRAAREPEFHAVVLGYLLGEEAVLIEFATWKGCDPGMVVMAAEALAAPAGDGPTQGAAQARAVPRLKSFRSPERTKSP